MRIRSLLRGLLPGGGAVVAGLLVLGVGLTLSGYDGPAALGAMYRGAFGTRDAVLSALLPRAIPLILVGLGIALSFKAGALNIGAEGQFYAGAVVATWVGLALGSWPRLLAVPTVLVAGLAAGSAWAAVPALLRLRFGVLEVISTLLLNFVADAGVSWMVQGPLQESSHNYPQSDPLPLAARLPGLAGTRLHLGLVLAIVLPITLWFLGRRSLPGLQLRATGLNPSAAEVMGGVSTRWVFGVALVGSGALAGLAGATEVSGTTFALFQNLSPGYGFTGIAVALLARLDPLGTVVTGLLFAGLEAGASAMQREAGVPAVAVYMVEATITIVVLLGDVARRRQLALFAGT
ncbi:MAG TPA: ABC transporter permease [Gemmatimonadales bacterium]|jgi:simple sugar transport system permease protein